VGRSENKSERLGDEGAENDKMFVKAHKGNADNHRLKRKASFRGQRLKGIERRVVALEKCERPHRANLSAQDISALRRMFSLPIRIFSLMVDKFTVEGSRLRGFFF